MEFGDYAYREPLEDITDILITCIDCNRYIYMYISLIPNKI